jgi:hypothetical protein
MPQGRQPAKPPGQDRLGGLAVDCDRNIKPHQGVKDIVNAGNMLHFSGQGLAIVPCNIVIFVWATCADDAVRR